MLLTRQSHPLDGSPVGGWFTATYERFLEGDSGGGDSGLTAAPISAVRAALMPSLDRVVGLLHPTDDVDGAGGAGGGTRRVLQTATLHPETDGYTEPRLRLEYKRIAFWLCQLRATAKREYDDLMAAFGAGPPLYVTEDSDGAAPAPAAPGGGGGGTGAGAGADANADD